MSQINLFLRILDFLGLDLIGLATIPLSFTFLAAALAFKHEKRWPFFFAHCVIVIPIICWTRIGHPVLDIFRGGFLAFSIVQASHALLLGDARKKFRLRGQAKPFENLLLIERVWWSLMWLSSPRAVGWTHEPTYRLPPRWKSKGRYHFILSQIKWLTWYMFFLEITRVPIFWKPTIAPSNPLAGSYEFLWRQAYVYAAGLGGYAAMCVIWHSLTITMVSYYIFEPEDFPPLFGSLKEAYTVGRFWGYVVLQCSSDRSVTKFILGGCGINFFAW